MSSITPTSSSTSSTTASPSLGNALQSLQDEVKSRFRQFCDFTHGDTPQLRLQPCTKQEILTNDLKECVQGKVKEIDLHQVRQLVENTERPSGDLLVQCCIIGDEDLVQKCIEKMENIDRCVRLPLIAAVLLGHRKIAGLLIDKIDDSSALQEPGDPLVFWAVNGGLTSVAKKLVAKGANIDLEGDRGLMILFYALAKGDSNLTLLLRRKGAELPDAESDALYSALEPSSYRALSPEQVTNLVNRLITYRVGTAYSDRLDQRTISHVAASEGKLEVVQRLFREGLFQHRPDQQGDFPYDLAQRNGHEEVMTCIEQNSGRESFSRDHSRGFF